MKWRKSSYSCSNGNCVEVAADNSVHVRDSKLGDLSPVLSFSADSWAQFVTAANDGQLTGNPGHSQGVGPDGPAPSLAGTALAHEVGSESS